MTSVNPYIVDISDASKTETQQIANDLGQLSEVITTFKNEVDDIMPSLMSGDTLHVHRILMHMNTFKLHKLKIRFESNLLTQRVLDDGSDLLDDLTEELLAVHETLLKCNQTYDGSEAFNLYTTEWLPMVEALCAKLKAFKAAPGRMAGYELFLSFYSPRRF